MAVKILMVDGDHAVLELAKSSISTLQWCDLVTVKDGRDAAKLLQNQKFDGVVTGDRIPNVDGFELIQHLKDSPLNARIPIVMLTGGDVIDTMRRGFKAGVTFFAVTPSNRERFFHLFNAVRGAMENERRRHHRLPYRTPVTCSLGDQGQNRFVAESVDISAGGISVKPSGGVMVGQVLELEFLLPQVSRPAHPGTQKSQKVLLAERDLPAAGPQKVRARVCYVAPSGESMGLDFQGLTPKQREAIEHYVTGGS
ncbi:MAG TPA: response regulator [Terriglobia bacterium]|nr:response regulator [Terriglobia bacterium]